jgi:hypothetical protein
VSHDDGGHAQAPVQVEQQLMNTLAGLVIQITGRLVGKQQPRAQDQGAGQGNPLLLPARQLHRTVVQALGKPHSFEHFPGDLLGLTPGYALDQGRHHGVLQRVELGQQVMELEHEPDGAVAERRQLVGRKGADILAADVDAALGRSVQGSQQVEQGALARSRGTHHRHHLPLLDLEVRALEHFDGLVAQPEGLFQIGDFYHRFQGNLPQS